MQEFIVTGINVPALADFDEVTKQFMKAKDISGGAVAIVKDQRLVLARGYTHNEGVMPHVQPTSLFRIASCSKPITRFAVSQLLGGDLDKPVAPILGLSAPPGKAISSEYFQVTVRQLIDHQSGLSASAGDLEASGAFGVPLPVNKYQVASTVITYPFIAPEYSNYGYLLLGLLIEKLTGSSYEWHVWNTVFRPLGVTRPFIGRSLLEERAPGEVVYHDAEVRQGESKVHADKRMVDICYGYMNMQNQDAFGGWVLAAPDYARLIAAHGSSFDFTSSGYFAGTVTWVRQVPNGVGFVALFNKDANGIGWDVANPSRDYWDALADIAAEISKSGSWPSHDLFGSVDIPLSGDERPSASCWRPGRLDIVRRGPDRAIWHKAWDNSWDAWKPSEFGWLPLDGEFKSAPIVCSWGKGRLDVFARGMDDGVWRKTWDDVWGQWKPSEFNWIPLPTATFKAGPSTTTWGQGRLDVFGLGFDGVIYHKAWDDSWGHWEPSDDNWAPLGGTFNTPPAAASWGKGRIDLVARGLDSAFYHKAWDKVWQPSQSGWLLLNGATFQSPPVAVRWGTGRIDVFGLGLDGVVYHKAWDDAWGHWEPVSGWVPLGGVFQGIPAAVCYGLGRIDLFARGLEGAIYHKAWDNAWGQWLPEEGWESLGGEFSGSPTATSWGEGHIDVFARGIDGRIWHKAWDNVWNDWKPSKDGWLLLG